MQRKCSRRYRSSVEEYSEYDHRHKHTTTILSILSNSKQYLGSIAIDYICSCAIIRNKHSRDQELLLLMLARRWMMSRLVSRQVPSRYCARCRQYKYNSNPPSKPGLSIRTLSLYCMQEGRSQSRLPKATSNATFSPGVLNRNFDEKDRMAIPTPTTIWSVDEGRVCEYDDQRNGSVKGMKTAFLFRVKLVFVVWTMFSVSW